ncbi:MAG: tRNA pseudouridine(38-40) synthase TruA [Clostridia bacterium]|nr:tRNA pseudouridine(38-40) synthase TruA [Clostridia bacterium]
MRNIKLFLQFDGAAFHGFQQQPNGDTVEAQLKKALSRLLGEACTVYGCSRTDAGVHANEFCCNFKTQSDRDCDKLLQGLNAVLPPQISVLSCAQAPESFHARYDCRAKEYAYCIWNGRTRNPFLLQRALFYPFPLDVAFLNEQAQDFVGTHDFSAFCASGASTKTSVRTIERCSVVRTGELVTFTVCGNGFLYHMVRIMVGTLLDLQRGKLPPGSIPSILRSADRTRAGITAPAEGLYLNRVFYDEGSLSDGSEG